MLQWDIGNDEDMSYPVDGTSYFQTSDSSKQAIFDIPLATDGSSVTFGYPLTFSGGLTKIGAGTLTLDAANSYGGDTIIAGGELALGSGTPGSLPSGTSVQLGDPSYGSGVLTWRSDADHRGLEHWPRKHYAQYVLG